MIFADEEYVRLYTSNTVTWKALGWEGQTVLMHLLRCFDNSGAFEFGKRTPVRAIAIATGLPEDIVTRGLESILAEEIWVTEATQLFWPRYVEAQTCRRSDRYRKRAERDRQSRQRDTESRESDNCRNDVQNGHAASRDVTPRRGGAGRGQASSSLKKTKDREKESADPPVPQSVTAHYFERFEALRGTKPIFNGKDGSAMKRLFKTVGFDEQKAKTIITNALSKDSWGSDTRTICDIARDPAKWLTAPIARHGASHHEPPQPNNLEKPYKLNIA